MNKPVSGRRSTVVIEVADPTQAQAELASLVGYLQSFTWKNGPPSIQIVAIEPPPQRGTAFVERRRRTVDRRQSARPPAPASGADSSADSTGTQAQENHAPMGVRHACTAREREIVALLKRGLTNKEMAQQLGIMEGTVKKHLQHIYNKCGVRRRALIMLGRSVAGTHFEQQPASP